ncbi:MAG: Mur ligase family protein [Candidatus Marinamargulisbacteria bacterium]
MMKIGVLGNGVTASAVREFLASNDDYQESSIEAAEKIITSPGIPPKEWPKIAAPIISDIDFAVQELKKQGFKGPIIGVTGTNGKTTVVSAIAHALNVTAFGNIGQPLINQLSNISLTQPLVLELSSFQLVSSPTLTCDISVLTNIEPDHLEWHETMESYEAAKLTLFKAGQQAFVPQSYCQHPAVQSVSVTAIESLPTAVLPQFIGQHNQRNLATILGVLSTVGMSLSDAKKALETYVLPAYRCERIYNHGGMQIINDSKATNMSATQAAVASFDDEKLLILAGQPKEPFNVGFFESIQSSCHTIYAAGALSKQRLIFPDEWQSKIHFFDTLEAATDAAIAATTKGMILFSPAAASFDEFKNYMDRGRAFTEYVKKSL